MRVEGPRLVCPKCGELPRLERPLPPECIAWQCPFCKEWNKEAVERKVK
jgi:hypothetical protein